MQTLWQDLRYGARMLAKKPGFTFVAVITFALGIGVNTAIFTVFNTLLRPLPVKDPDGVVRIESSIRGGNFSYPEYAYYREHARAFSSVIAYAQDKALIGVKSSAEESEEVAAEFVSDNFFSALGGAAALGRVFSPEENAAEPVAILSYHFWKRRFSGDPEIIGKTALLDGRPFIIVGVTERKFVGLTREGPAIWLPMAMRAEMPSVWSNPVEKNDWHNKRDFQWLKAAARLKPESDAEQAGAELTALFEQLAQGWPKADPNDRISARPISGFGAVDHYAWRSFGLILISTGIVLLIACSNIASLLLARAAVRQKEIGVRSALGASRGRIVRQLLTESCLLAFVGGLAGLMLAWWTLELLIAQFISSNGGVSGDSLAIDLSPDARILAFTILLTLLSGLAAGIAPAMRASRVDLVAMLKDTGTAFGQRLARSRLSDSMVVAQIVLCLTLLIPAGLLLRGLAQALTADPGFETKKLLVVNYSLELSGYTEARARLFKQELQARLAGLPGAESVSAGDPPLAVSRATINAPGLSETGEKLSLRASYYSVAPNWFETVGIPILRGRGFAADDMRGVATEVVVSQSTARNLWGEQDALGKIIELESSAKEIEAGAAPFAAAQIVGIAQDAQTDRLGQIPSYFIYIPEEPRSYLDASLLVRTSGDAREMKARAQAEVRALEPVVRLWLNSMEEEIAMSKRVGETRAASELAAGLGLLALLLASVGLYGVMSYTVAERTREIGIRMALGANSGDAVRMEMKRGMTLTMIGLAIGLPASLALTRLLKSFIFGLSATDPLTFALISSLLIAVSLAACYIPARRAAKVDPMVALRYE